MRRQLLAVLALTGGLTVLAPQPAYPESCEDVFWGCHGGAMQLYEEFDNLAAARMWFDFCMDYFDC